MSASTARSRMSPRTTRAYGKGRSSFSMCSARRRSNSTATKGRPVEAKSRESAPRPGPISTTGSSGSSTKSATRRATRGSQRKFCPIRLLGRTPSPRSVAGTPEEAERWPGGAERRRDPGRPPLEAEEASRRRVGRFLERSRCYADRSREPVAPQSEAGGYVSFAPMRHGSKIGRIGFEHDVGQVELTENRWQGALLEGRCAPHSNLGPQRH